MKIQRLLSGLIGAVWVCLVVTVVAVAAYIAITRTVFNALPDVKDDIEVWISETSGLGVRVDELHGEWSLLYPSITITGLSIYDSKFLDRIALLEGAKIQLDIPSSFESYAPVFRVSLLSGELQVSKAQSRFNIPDDTIKKIDGIELPASDTANHIFETLFRFPFDLEIKDFRFMVSDKEDVVHPFLLNSHIQNRAKKIQGELALVSEAQGDLSFLFDVSLGRGVIEDLNGGAWLRSRKFPLYPWLPRIGRWDVNDGSLDGQLWLEVDAGRVERIQGNVDLSAMEAIYVQDQSSVETFHLNRLSMKLRYVDETYRDDRMLDIYDFDVDSDAGSWANRRLRFSQFSDDQSQYQEVQLDSVNLNIFSKTALYSNLLPEKFHTILTELAPVGELSDVVVRLKKPTHASISSVWVPDFIQLKARDLGWENTHGIPSIKNLSGWIHSNGEGALASFEMTNGILGADTIYEHVLNELDVSALLRVRRIDTGWMIESNRLRARLPEAELVLEVALSKMGDGPIGLSVHGNILEGDVENIDQLLPTKILTKGLSSWLLYALKEGDLVLGDLMWEGALKKTNKTEHTLGLRFDLDNILLDYFEQWPPLEQGMAVVDVVNGDTYVAIEHASVSGATLLPSTAQVIVSHKNPVSVELIGTVKGSATQLLDYLASSPLVSKIPEAIFDLGLRGDAMVGLDLAVPLANDAERHYDVEVNLAAGMLKYAPIKLSLSKLIGQINYSYDNGVSIPHLKGNFLNHPITMSAFSTRKNKKVVNTTLNIKGSLPIHSLFDWQGWARLPGVSGASPLTTRIEFPWSQLPIDIVVESELNGVTVALPSPLTKQPEQREVFRSHLSISSDSSFAKLEYGNKLRGLFRWNNEHPPVGHIVWGKPQPQVALGKDESGVVIEFNKVSIDLEPWIDFFKAQKHTPTIPQALANGAPANRDPFSVFFLLSDSTLRFDRYYLEKVRATYRQINLMNLVMINSPQLAGAFEWPLGSAGGRLNIDLNLLHYPLSHIAVDSETSAQGAKSDTTPIKPPNIDLLGEWDGVRVAIDKLMMHGEDWGRWETIAHNSPEELVFESITALSDNLSLKAKGEWLKQQGGVSRVEGNADIGNMAQLFRGVGQEELLSSKQGKMNFSFSWPGAPQDFNPTQLNGRADIELKKGRVNVSGKGAVFASLFGLLNLKGVFKLLKLDFSDITEKGLGFDRLDGEYLINHELLTIGRAELKGNTLETKVSGTIDFNSRKLKQQIDIILPLSDGLIIPAALTGSLPILATVFVVDQAFGSTINKLTKTRFTITGTIENPKFRLKTGG